MKLDTASLSRYLEEHIEGFKGPITEKAFSEGQSNPTFLLDTPGGSYVLRCKPPGELLKSAHAVDREYRVMNALANTDVPVPRMLAFCDDDSVIGSMFYIMEFIDGRIFWDPTLPDLSNDERSTAYDQMNRALAALHRVDTDAVGLSDYGKPGNYFERQVHRWIKQYRASETENIPAMETLIQWLPDNMPEDDGRVSIVHGDYRLDNMIFHPTEPKILAVLDWELSTLGHPFADLAYQCMQWRMAHGGTMSGLGGVDRESLGIPSEADYVARYCERMGIEGIPNWDFYLAFSFFRLAAILQGVKKRAIEGNAASTKAHDMGALTRPLSEMGAALIHPH